MSNSLLTKNKQQKVYQKTDQKAKIIQNKIVKIITQAKTKTQNKAQTNLQKKQTISNQALKQNLEKGLSNINVSNDLQTNFTNLQKENKIVQAIVTKFAGFPKVTFYGGANVRIDSADYLGIQKLANSLSKQGFMVASGGGPGIMAAAISGGNGLENGEENGGFGPNLEDSKTNEYKGKPNNEKNSQSLENGAKVETKISKTTQTLGFRLNLTSEPPLFLAANDYLFTDFAPRKLALRNSDILIFAPGGFGTLDELMEVLTLLKTKKMPKKQIFLYNSKFWAGLLSWICKEIMANSLAVEEFLQYFVVCDQVSQILEMIQDPNLYKEKSKQNSCFIL